ncbi:hypothetical protein lerEdw1_002435, partial [Lerista edwardsae]
MREAALQIVALDLLMGGRTELSHFVKDPFYVVGADTRLFGCKERYRMEKPALKYCYPQPQQSNEHVNTSSVLSEGQKAPDLLRHLSRASAFTPPSTETKGHRPDSKQGTRLISPSRPAWSSPNAAESPPAPLDYQSAEEGPTTKWQPGPDRDNSSKAQALVLGSGDSPPKEPTEDASSRWKAALPQRHLPAKMKWTPSVKDDSLPKSSGSLSGQKVFQRWQSFPSQSSSSSEPEGLSGQGKPSLRISESCLQMTPPPFPREEDDDDVFFNEMQPQVAGTVSQHALPAPAPLPPLSLGTVANSREEFPPSPPPPPPPPRATVEVDQPPAEKSTRLGDEGFAPRNFKRYPRSSSEREKVDSNTTVTKGSWAAPSPPIETSGLKLNGSAPPCLEVQQPPLAVQGPIDTAPTKQPREAVTANWELENGNVSPKSYPGKKNKTPEDIKEEALAKEIIHKDKSLADILDPDSKMKTTMDLMEGIFPIGARMLDESMKRKMMQKRARSSVPDDKREETEAAAASLVQCPAYSSVSAPKAELLNKIKDLPEEAGGLEEQADINQKK